jgi:hypothetical protein
MSRPLRLGPVALAVGLALLGSACTTSTSGGQGRHASPGPSLVYRHPGGQNIYIVPPTIAPELKPYPFSSPTPPDRATPLDGTYMKIVPFHGRAVDDLPILCFRCIPYRPDVGVSTLILYHGEYFVHHQLSGTKAAGSFVLDGDRLRLFNDANCPQDVGTYTWRVTQGRLELSMVYDPCPFENLRAKDLAAVPWIRVDPCTFRIRGLWPAAVAC